MATMPNGMTTGGGEVQEFEDEPRTVECYELEPGEAVGCVECAKERNNVATYHRGEAVLVGMLDSPYGDGQAHYMCNHHLTYFFSGDNIDRVDPQTLST
jgi:hypothetical protein